MPTAFKTNGYAQITPVEITQATERSVFIVDFMGVVRRYSKVGSYERYHDTWEAAHEHLMTRAEDKLAGARRSLQQAQDFLGNVKGLKKPA